MFTLELHDKHTDQWVEREVTYRTLEGAVADAITLWDDKDYFYDLIRVRKTTYLCTLTREE